MTPSEAWDEGTNIRTAIRHAPEETRAALIRMVKDTVEFIDAKKTLTTVSDYILTTQTIEDEFPTLKLEELRIVCRDLKTGKHGKLYERLKTAEFVEAIRTFEGTRAEHLERIHTRHTVTRGLREGQTLIPHEPETLLDVIRRRNPLHNNGYKANEPDRPAVEPEKPPGDKEPEIPPSG